MLPHISPLQYFATFLAVAVANMSNTATAAVTVYAYESGGDVIVSGGGRFDLTNLTVDGNGHTGSSLNPSLATFQVGDGFGESYRVLSGPAEFGPGILLLADSSSGDLFGVLRNGATEPVLVVPRLYSSGELLQATATYSGQSFHSLALTPGDYVWSWGSGDHADSLTLKIGEQVPEPSTAMLTGMLTLFGVSVVRRRAKG